MPLNNIPHDNNTLLFHVLNVGDGDSIIVEAPADDNGNRAILVIDCFKAAKTETYLADLGITDLDLVVATHPHRDHILGLKSVLQTYETHVTQFWDSGFRHNSTTWDSLFSYLNSRPEIRFMRPTAGLITNIGRLKVTVLAPSISLRNRYDSYGVNINNASIVLKLEFNDRAVILAGDAQWDSWARITEDFPHFMETQNPDQKIQVTEHFNHLECDIFKVAHHGSKHGTSLEYVEKLGRSSRFNIGPRHAVISHGTGYDFPHTITTRILEEAQTQSILTSRGSVIYTINNSIHCYQADDEKNDNVDTNTFQQV